MSETTPRGIQATLFDYFQDTEYFTLQEAEEHVLDHQNRDVNTESIRARIYEGIDKGLFERVGKGLFTVTRKDEQGRENTCLLINGDGRDLSMIPDNSVDAIITDHPYDTSKSLKGGNRDFATYELFRYDEQDFREKLRVLKPGCFLVEFLPEENGDNYQYLFQVKEMARKAGFEYYARVPWKKGDFVANTGRKSKNTEDICFFSKGRARELRPDAKKDKAEPSVAHFMSGAAGMLPTVFDVAVPNKRDRVHQAEKPTMLLEQILRFVTKEDELVLDQFGGSGNLGKAALNTHRNSIVIEKDLETYQRMCENVAALGNVEIHTAREHEAICVAIDALEAAADSPEHMAAFAEYQNAHGMSMPDAYFALGDISTSYPEQQEAFTAATRAIEEADLAADMGPNILRDTPDQTPTEPQCCCDWCGDKAETTSYRTLYENTEFEQTSRYNECADCAALSTEALMKKVEGLQAPQPKVLECSSRGDKRFSPVYAKISIRGKEQSIEEFFLNARRTEDGKRAGRDKPFDYIICPFTGDKLPAKDAADLYRGLWISYFNKNPDLVEYAAQFDDFSNAFHKDGLFSAHEEVIGAYVKGDRDRYVATVKASHWYKNMAQRLSGKKEPRRPSLDAQIQGAETKAGEKVTEQMSMFGPDRPGRGHWGR